MIGEVYPHVTRYVAQDTMQKMKGKKGCQPGRAAEYGGRLGHLTSMKTMGNHFLDNPGDRVVNWYVIHPSQRFPGGRQLHDRCEPAKDTAPNQDGDGQMGES